MICILSIYHTHSGPWYKHMKVPDRELPIQQVAPAGGYNGHYTYLNKILLEHYIKQQLFPSLPLHTGPSLNCPGETTELWQNAVELASGKDLKTFKDKGPNTQVPAKLSLSKQIVSQLLYKYVWLTQILQALLLGACVGRLGTRGR